MYRRPIPRVVFERVSMVGIVLMLMLFTVGLNNDIGRHRPSHALTRGPRADADPCTVARSARSWRKFWVPAECARRVARPRLHGERIRPDRLRPMASRRQIHVGGVAIGGGAPVAVQSMTTTKTHDATATLAQMQALADAGCEIVRVAVPGLPDAAALVRIVAESPVPIIADIHFNASLALKAMDAGVAAVRINPGNIGGADKVEQVVRRAIETVHADAHRRQLRLAARAPALDGHRRSRPARW